LARDHRAGLWTNANPGRQRTELDAAAGRRLKTTSVRRARGRIRGHHSPVLSRHPHHPFVAEKNRRARRAPCLQRRDDPLTPCGGESCESPPPPLLPQLASRREHARPPHLPLRRRGRRPAAASERRSALVPPLRASDAAPRAPRARCTTGCAVRRAFAPKPAERRRRSRPASNVTPADGRP